MNRLKAIMYFNQRGYKSIIKKQSFRNKIRNATPRAEKDLYRDFDESEVEIEENDYDIDRLEGNFSSMGDVYDEHNRETKYNKELLKTRIVAKNYFKSKEPSFLTWSERNEIKALHSKDSTEWTPEQLSTAFPALPETIKKILRISYMPKTAEAVIKYDQNVIDNWKQFKAGNLALNPKLEAHLQKFKNRDIQAVNLKAIAEKFVKPKPNFLSPKSTFFTSIVRDCTEPKNITDKPPLLQLNASAEANDSKSTDLILHNGHKKKKVDWKYSTSDEFLERKVNKLTDHSNLSVEEKFFIQEYKDKKSKDTVIELGEEKVEILESSLECNDTLKPHTVQASTLKPPVTQVPLGQIEAYQNSVETGIIKWEKKSATNEEMDYPRFIKVPYQKAKKGVIFRVNDRYYDCDGEFLYRIPGLKWS